MEPASSDPYQTPKEPGLPPERPPHKLGNGLLRAFFGFGCVGYLLGEFVTFAPGGGTYWFITTAILSAIGCFIPRMSYRLAAVLFLVLSLLGARDEHLRGVRSRAAREHARELAPR
jgi:hypothetical protein